MNNYNNYKNKIEEYLNIDDVVDDSDTISAYTLYEMVNNKFERLRSIHDDNDFEKKVLSIYMKKNIKNFINVMKSRRKECSIIPSVYEDSLEIMLTIGGRDTKYLKKDIGDEHFYCDKYQDMIDNEIIDGCLHEIYNVFDTLEEFLNFVNLSDNDTPQYNKYGNFGFIVDDTFEGKISYDDKGNVDYKLKFLGMNYNEKDRNWYGERESIESIVNNNSLNLLKKIPISVHTLNGVFKKIYDENYEKQKTYSK